MEKGAARLRQAAREARAVARRMAAAALLAGLDFDALAAAGELTRGEAAALKAGGGAALPAPADLAVDLVAAVDRLADAALAGVKTGGRVRP